uniref:Uncharacterized protein n=1 Tax=Acrobeloides nanus TaxID=290746 RepID=A0A914EM58_9BILA
MYLERSYLFGIFFMTCGTTSFGWEFGQPKEEQPNYSAWYQLPNPAPSGAYPPAAYDRERAGYDRSSPNYERSHPSVYDRERERPPMHPRRTQPDPYYPEAHGSITNNLLPPPRTPPAGMVVGAFYPGVQSGSSHRRLTQDVANIQD